MNKNSNIDITEHYYTDDSTLSLKPQDSSDAQTKDLL